MKLVVMEIVVMTDDQFSSWSFNLAVKNQSLMIEHH
jgi:hypothetical protein